VKDLVKLEERNVKCENGSAKDDLTPEARTLLLSHVALFTSSFRPPISLFLLHNSNLFSAMKIKENHEVLGI
jgi:hypothetical protein